MRTQRGFEPIPSPGIYIRYRRLPGRRRQSQREMLRVLQQTAKNIHSFDPSKQIRRFLSCTEQMARDVLNWFEGIEGLGEIHPHWKETLKAYPEMIRRARIEARIEEIRAEAGEVNALEVLSVRR